MYERNDNIKSYYKNISKWLRQPRPARLRGRRSVPSFVGLFGRQATAVLLPVLLRRQVRVLAEHLANGGIGTESAGASDLSDPIFSFPQAPLGLLHPALREHLHLRGAGCCPEVGEEDGLGDARVGDEVVQGGRGSEVG